MLEMIDNYDVLLILTRVWGMIMVAVDQFGSVQFVKNCALDSGSSVFQNLFKFALVWKTQYHI